MHERACGNGGTKNRRRSQYRELFFANKGPGPYSCFFCDKQVIFAEVIIHHIDHNEINNELANLSPAHRGCHNGYHFKQLWKENSEKMLASETRGHRVPHSKETRENLSKSHKQKGHRPSDEAIEKAAFVNRGKPRSEETKRKISEGHKKRANKSSGGGGAL